MTKMELLLDKETRFVVWKKRLKVSRKWIKMLLVGLSIVVVINIAILTIFLKFLRHMFSFGIMIEWVNVICISVLSSMCWGYPEIVICISVSSNAKWILMNQIFEVMCCIIFQYQVNQNEILICINVLYNISVSSKPKWNFNLYFNIK